MIGAIKRRWKSNKSKCSDKEKEKVTSLLPSFPTSSSSRKGTLPPVDFIHVNSGRIELHPGTEKELCWGQHLQYDTARHSWCGPQQMGVLDKPSGKKKDKQEIESLIQRISQLEKLTKDLPNLEPVVHQLKEEFTQSLGRQEKLVADLESLYLRANTLESHNKALANIILPTLIRLTKEKSPRLSPTVDIGTSPIMDCPALKLSEPPSVTRTSSASKCVSLVEEKPKVIAKAFSQSPTKTPQPLSNSRVPKSPAKSSPKPSDSDPPGSGVNKHKVVECRIPLLRSTTHPPKNCSSGSKSSLKLKSRLPVRKSCSSSNSPSTSSVSTPAPTPSTVKITKLNNKESLVIENKRVQEQPLLPSVPSKDEGYSTMSNGDIDADCITTPKQPQTSNGCNSATFTRPKNKIGASAETKEPKTNGISGTWTKKKATTNTTKTATITTTLEKASPIKQPNSETRTYATATLLGPATVTTTKENNVRIVRGIPHEIRFSREGSYPRDNDDFSGNTVLWEDSDDSDILFLPIEVSSSSGGSESTLVPYARTGSRLSSYNDATSTLNSVDSTTTTSSSSTYYTAQGTATEGSSTAASSSTNTPTPRRGRNLASSSPRNKNSSGNNNTNVSREAGAIWDTVDEQDLVQRWMRLDDMRRNNYEAWGEEDEALWSWDWDGIMRSSAKPKRDRELLKPSSGPAPIPSSSETLDIIPQPHRLRNDDSDFWETPTNKTLTLTSDTDSSGTWTKSTKAKNLVSNPQDLEEEVIIPASTELDFTAEFYRLTSSGTEDKIIQTETCSSSSTENIQSNCTNDNNMEESDLFLQCKNCLEKMSKLISLQQQTSPEEPEEDKEDIKARLSISEQVAKIFGIKEGKASKWLPISNSSKDDIGLSLVSSTDSSEGLTLSPSME